MRAGQSGPAQQLQAPGYGRLAFTVPAAGSYQLPDLGPAGDGLVLDEQGRQLSLHDLMGDKLILLSFIYSTCTDSNGCPLATAVFYRIKRQLENEPGIANQLRLLTLSFNPVNDTPDVMRLYGENLSSGGLDWRFLTTESEQQLNPILDDYQQTVQKNFDEKGQFKGTFSHVLRVYLIDKGKHIRNIYSVSFLHPDTLINDIKTLIQEATETMQTIVNKSANNSQTLDLLKYVKDPPLGLPAVPVPERNPVTKEKIKLGRKLFFDRRLSHNNTMSCAMCHIPEQGFTSNEMKTAVGIEGRTVGRNTPTVYNVAYYQSLFHDGRENTLEQQVWGPLLARNEMGNPSIGFVLNKINSSPDYDGLFEKAFSRPAGMETVGMALASYQRSLNSANSRFDQWKYGDDKQVLNSAEIRGYRIFTGKGGCSQCHVIGDQYALFTDSQFHNTGIGYSVAMHLNPEIHRIQLAPGVYADVDTSIIDSVSEPIANDMGRYNVSLDPHDRWKYKTPSLRNIVLTAPYMHNGELETLQQVVVFYNQGGVVNPELDSRIKPLNLTDKEQADLVKFLGTLTGDNIKEIVDDALSEQVGDSR